MWRSESLFAGPSIANTAIQGRILEVNTFRPVLDVKALAVVFDPDARALVDGLLIRRCPDAIARLVVSVDIAAFKAVAVPRPGPHVLEKSLERIPTRADANASPAVIRVGLV